MQVQFLHNLIIDPGFISDTASLVVSIIALPIFENLSELQPAFNLLSNTATVISGIEILTDLNPDNWADLSQLELVAKISDVFIHVSQTLALLAEVSTKFGALHFLPIVNIFVFTSSTCYAIHHGKNLYKHIFESESKLIIAQDVVGLVVNITQIGLTTLEISSTIILCVTGVGVPALAVIIPIIEVISAGMGVGQSVFDSYIDTHIN